MTATCVPPMPRRRAKRLVEVFSNSGRFSGERGGVELSCFGSVPNSNNQNTVICSRSGGSFLRIVLSAASGRAVLFSQMRRPTGQPESRLR